MSLIAVVEKAIVEKRKLLTHNEILDGITLASMLPGPMAVNVVAFVGYRISGIRGVVVSAFGVILPSFVLVVSISHLYFHYGETVNVSNIFQGITPAIAAIVLSVAINMFKKNKPNFVHIVLIMMSFLFLIVSGQVLKFYAPFIIILIYGVIGWAYFEKHPETEAMRTKNIGSNTKRLLFTFVAALTGVIVLVVLPIPVKNDSLLTIATTFGSLSVMLFGGGYVFIPMIQDIVVDKYVWLTEQQFIDGIAVGQMTPGPIVITVAFIGYHLKGLLGAAVATIAIFAPPIWLMILAARMMDLIKNNSKVEAVLKGVRLGIIGMIFYAVFSIMQSSLTGLSGCTVIIERLLVFVLAFAFLLKFNISVIWAILVSGIIGYIFF